jgi:hypothetical protein
MPAGGEIHGEGGPPDVADKVELVRGRVREQGEDQFAWIKETRGRISREGFAAVLMRIPKRDLALPPLIDLELEVGIVEVAGIAKDELSVAEKSGGEQDGNQDDW